MNGGINKVESSPPRILHKSDRIRAIVWILTLAILWTVMGRGQAWQRQDPDEGDTTFKEALILGAAQV